MKAKKVICPHCGKEFEIEKSPQGTYYERNRETILKRYHQRMESEEYRQKMNKRAMEYYYNKKKRAQNGKK